MKSRQEIKANAKEAMYAQRPEAILIPLLLTVFGIIIGTLSAIPSIIQPDPDPFSLVSLVSLAVSLLSSLFMAALGVNVFGAFILIYSKRKAEVGKPVSDMKVRFWRKAGGMYYMGLWVTVWSMLLVIPGIVKGIAYSMTPFILADCPNVTATQALKVSQKMTRGHKLELFVMYLSWIGWCLLVPLTLGILGVVYVMPYMYSTFAGYYSELKDIAIKNGILSPAELGEGMLSG